MLVVPWAVGESIYGIHYLRMLLIIKIWTSGNTLATEDFHKAVVPKYNMKTGFWLL